MLIEAKNISKSYHNLKVLKGIHLSVAKGEIVSIIGASGAGKSTFLHILGTLDSPDNGEILFNGENIVHLKGKKLAQFRNENIGFVFQFHNLLPEFTALENVCMPAYLGKVLKQKEAEKKAGELLDFFGLSERSHHLPSELSGGEQQRVAIARALINSPEIVFADEPSGNLDSKNAEELHHLLLKLRADFNQTFVIVTHNKELAALADRKVLMQDGLILENP